MGNSRAGYRMVRNEHRSSTVEQVLTQQLRFQVPDFPYNVSHGGVLGFELRGSSTHRSGSHAEHKIDETVSEDHGAVYCFLFLRRLRERVIEVPSGVV